MEILSYVAPAEYLIKTLGFPASETWRHGIGCAGFVKFFYFCSYWDGRLWRLKYLTWAPEENQWVDTCLCTVSVGSDGGQ